MDQWCSESDVSLSPSQILERLQVLRQLQLMQRGKLHQQRLQYQDNSETSSSITEIVSQFSSSTSYNTFRSLLQSPQDASNNAIPRQDGSNLSPKVRLHDLIEGVSVLNLSQESEFILNSPTSSKSRISPSSRTDSAITAPNRSAETKSLVKQQISLDEIPILSPKQDFEALIVEKLKTDKTNINNPSSQKKDNIVTVKKKTFLKRGEGTARFGLRKNGLVIQDTKSLPWRRKDHETKSSKPVKVTKPNNFQNKAVDVQILITESPKPIIKKLLGSDHVKTAPKAIQFKETSKPFSESQQQKKDNKEIAVDSSSCDLHVSQKQMEQLQLPKGKHPLTVNRGKTWAAILTKEQDNFLTQLKQSEYYKNFVSPAKSTISDISCDDNLHKLRQERETAEQNMFDLLENKVTNESFNIESSFFNKFLRKSKLECSGESTPLVMQKCLANNPELLHIFPDLRHKKRNENSLTEAETCNSECTDCCSDASSIMSSCCSCKTIEPANTSIQSCLKNKEVHKKDSNTRQKGPRTNKVKKADFESSEVNKCHDDTVTESDTIHGNMAEINAKLVATSELLKERLQELEDEIEIFRQENANLAKMREEVDLERQKFYEEKNAYEQKFNEEKILSEYYLAEEKDKLNKQKLIYERQVREMRGRLNKKEKDEIINLKKEICDLKDEVRIKDARSTSTIARLRNHIKIMEKEKKDQQNEIDKLKKENRRIEHKNDITRRLTNLKYLEQINKKLAHISSKDPRSEVDLDKDVKYKSYEIERQSRSRKVEPVAKRTSRPRAKSVPNLKVTSRYAKYFSQRDAVSQFERNKTSNENLDTYTCPSDNDDVNENEMNNSDNTESIPENNESDSDEENYLEKVYMERFQSTSPTSSRSSLTNPSTRIHDFKENPDGFFISKTNSHPTTKSSKSPRPTSPYLQNNSGSNTSKSPISILSNRLSGRKSPANFTIDQNVSRNSGESNSNLQNWSKSQASVLSNKPSSQKLTTVINQEQYRDKLMTISPEPTTNKTSSTKTNLNPTEIKKQDGSRELRFPNGNVKYISADGKYIKFLYYNGDIKENFFDEGRIKYFYSEAKTIHTAHADGLEVLEFPDGQVEKRYKDGSTEIRLPNGSVRYYDPKNEHVREEWRFPDGTALTVAADGEQRVVFSNGQVEVHAKDHKRREFPDGTVKLVYNDGTSETRYSSGRVRIKDKHGNLIMDSAPG